VRFVYQIFYTDSLGEKHLVGRLLDTYEAALDVVRTSQAIQTSIYADRTIQWPTYIAEIVLTDSYQPIATTQITEVPWP
jgi:hypothetical protein